MCIGIVRTPCGIHHHDCGDYNNGKGKQPASGTADDGWEGPFQTYQDAKNTADKISKIKNLPCSTDCQHCF